MRKTYDNLHLCVLNREQHERTCGYWYTVTDGYSTSHTAFRTRYALGKWLEKCGLALTVQLTDAGVFSCQPIAGAYRTEMHYTEDELAAWDALLPVAITREMSNGDYTEGRVTLDADGIRTVHVLNPNRVRVVHDYQESRRMEDGEA
jgi:hypothetical protein